MYVSKFSVIAVALVLALPSMLWAQEQAAAPLDDFLDTLKTIDVEVAGHRAKMIFDTGGGFTVITPELADRVACAPWGQLSGFRLGGERLTMRRCRPVTIHLGARRLTTQEVGIFDVTALLPAGAPRIDGILSLDTLAQTPFTIDLLAGRLTLETADSLAMRTEGATEVPIRLHRQAGGASLTVMARVLSAKGPLWMQLDAGSDAPLLIPPSSAAALGVTPGIERDDLRITLDSAAGPQVEANADARVRDMIIDGNIGLPVLRTWTLSFDLERCRLWIKPKAK